MYLINEKALVARSSSCVLFFKQTIDPFTFEKSWKLYNKLDIRGFVYWIKGNKRIQITTDEKVFIYLIHPDTFEPTLENVINNFMGCTQMMYGSKVRFGITYKINQKSFDIWSRKLKHSYNANVYAENFDGSIGLPMESMDAFIIGKGREIRFFSTEGFKEMHGCKMTIDLLPSKTREPSEIIAIRTNNEETLLAVISGKNLCMSEQFANQLFLFRRIMNVDPT